MSNLSGRHPETKTPKLTRAEVAEGKAYMEYVKLLPCAVCGRPGPSDAHHCIHDRYGTRKAPDKDTIPLCKNHHQWGPDAIHNGKETWRQNFGADTSYIKRTRSLVALCRSDDPNMST